jgi:hypothetical protein
MKTYRVYIAGPTTFPHWDYSTTVVAESEADALRFAYEKWKNEGSQVPALNTCRFSVNEIKKTSFEQQSDTGGSSQYVASSNFTSVEAAEAAFMSYAVAADPNILFDYSGTYAIFGPLIVSYAVNLNSLIFEVEVKFGPKSLAKVLLNPDNPCASIGGVLTFISWEFGICLDMSKRTISIKGKANMPFVGGREFDVVIVNW